MFVSWQHPLWFVQSGEICSERGKNVQLLHSFGANYFHQVRNAQLFQKTINRSFFGVRAQLGVTVFPDVAAVFTA